MKGEIGTYLALTGQRVVGSDIKKLKLGFSEDVLDQEFKDYLFDSAKLYNKDLVLSFESILNSNLEYFGCIRRIIRILKILGWVYLILLRGCTEVGSL